MVNKFQNLHNPGAVATDYLSRSMASAFSMRTEGSCTFEGEDSIDALSEVSLAFVKKTTQPQA